MRSSGFKRWLCHPAHQEAELCKTRLHRITAQEEIKPDYLLPAGRAGGELFCLRSKHEHSWRWDFTDGNTATRGELPFFQGEQSPSLLICKAFWRCDAHMVLFIV